MTGTASNTHPRSPHQHQEAQKCGRLPPSWKVTPGGRRVLRHMQSAFNVSGKSQLRSPRQHQDPQNVHASVANLAPALRFYPQWFQRPVWLQPLHSES
eukprot:878732-Amphidinium_carterae.1